MFTERLVSSLMKIMPGQFAHGNRIFYSMVWTFHMLISVLGPIGSVLQITAVLNCICGYIAIRLCLETAEAENYFLSEISWVMEEE